MKNFWNETLQPMQSTSKRLWLTSLVLAALFAMTACGGTDASSSIAASQAPSASQTASVDSALTDAINEVASYAIEDRTYIVGLDDTFAPMGFRDDDNNLVGFDIDLANAVSERLGVPFEFQPIDWTTKELELNNKSIDFIWNGYSITPEREEEVAFSTPYLDNKQIIVVMADSPIQNKADIAGKTVTLQGESAALEAVLKDQTFVDSLAQPPVEFASNNEAFADLEAGRADAMVVDEVLARYYMNLKGEEKYRVLEDNFGDEQFGIGMRKEDTALIKAVNVTLQALKDEGIYDDIYEKWFSVN